MRPVNRAAPRGPAQAYVTYRIISPSDREVVTVCSQVGCLSWQHGWDTLVDETSDLGRRQAAWIRTGRTGRSYRELRGPDGQTVFRFDAHQRCFTEHRTRPELYVVQDGDWRGNPRRTQPRIHDRAEDWVEDFATHQDRLNTAQRRG